MRFFSRNICIIFQNFCEILPFLISQKFHIFVQIRLSKISQTKILKNNPKVQSYKVPKVQSYKVPKVQSYKVPKVQYYKIPKVQSYKVPKVQSYKVPKVQSYKVPKVQSYKRLNCFVISR